MPGVVSECSLSAKSGVCVIPVSETEIEEIKAQLNAQSGDTRRNTCWRLTDNLALAKAVLPEIINLLRDPCLVRRVAIELLGKIGPEAAPAVSRLVKLLGIEDCYGRRDIAQALGRIGSKEAAPFLRDLLRDSPMVRDAAVGALIQIFDAN